MIDNEKARKKGVLLTISRVDRHRVNERWLYKLRKITVSVYDPSSVEIKNLFSGTTSKAKIESILYKLCELKKINERLRKDGEQRKIEKGLKTTKLVDRYIEEKTIKRVKKRLKEKKVLRLKLKKKKKLDNRRKSR